MTGYDLLWWLEELWYDLMNLGSANIAWVVVRLLIVYVVVWFFGRLLLDFLRSAKRGFLRWIFRPFHRVLTAPKRWLERRKVDRENRQSLERQKEREQRMEEIRRREEAEKKAHERELFEKLMKQPPKTHRNRR
jgi:cell shape-determining protein MreC